MRVYDIDFLFLEDLLRFNILQDSCWIDGSRRRMSPRKVISLHSFNILDPKHSRPTVRDHYYFLRLSLQIASQLPDLQFHASQVRQVKVAY